MESSRIRDQPHVSCIGRRILYHSHQGNPSTIFMNSFFFSCLRLDSLSILSPKKLTKMFAKPYLSPLPSLLVSLPKTCLSALFCWQVAPACEASVCITNPCVLFWLSHLRLGADNDALSCPSYRAPWLVLLTHSSGPGFRKSAHSCLPCPPGRGVTDRSRSAGH